ncbi:hypothetical protein GJ496_002408 [Pomphorhynchus laevis]|nr:hypothetical protein GJ496_002408 [Pomphorhynchus laevis]
MVSHCSYLTSLHNNVDNDKLSDSISVKLNNHSSSQIMKERVDTEDFHSTNDGLCYTQDSAAQQCQLDSLDALSHSDEGHDRPNHTQLVKRVPRYRFGQCTPESTLIRYPADNSNRVFENMSTSQFSDPNRYQYNSPINYLSTKINLLILSTYEKRRQGHVSHFQDGHVGAPVDDHRESTYIGEAPAHIS